MTASADCLRLFPIPNPQSLIPLSFPNPFPTKSLEPRKQSFPRLFLVVASAVNRRNGSALLAAAATALRGCFLSGLLRGGLLSGLLRGGLRSDLFCCLLLSHGNSFSRGSCRDAATTSHDDRLQPRATPNKVVHDCGHFFRCDGFASHRASDRAHTNRVHLM